MTGKGHSQLSANKTNEENGLFNQFWAKWHSKRWTCKFLVMQAKGFVWNDRPNCKQVASWVDGQIWLCSFYCTKWSCCFKNLLKAEVAHTVIKCNNYFTQFSMKWFLFEYFNIFGMSKAMLEGKHRKKHSPLCSAANLQKIDAKMNKLKNVMLFAFSASFAEYRAIAKKHQHCQQILKSIQCLKNDKNSQWKLKIEIENSCINCNSHCINWFTIYFIFIWLCLLWWQYSKEGKCWSFELAKTIKIAFQYFKIQLEIWG